MSAYRSALAPDPQPLLLFLVAALALHFLAATFMFCFTLVMPEPVRPPLAPQYMDVSFEVLPRPTSAMPDRASRAPRPQGEAMQAAPAPQVADPPPVESDLVHHREEAPAPPVERPSPQAEPARQGTDDRHADDRDRLMRELMRQELMDDFDAPPGTADRTATDPDSTTDEYIPGSGSGIRGDPELARYEAQLQRLFHEHFHPLRTVVQANPDIHAIVTIRIDVESGRVLGYEMFAPSGNASFDGAAERAVQNVRNVPPPPEAFRDQYRHGFRIKFEPDRP